MSNRTVDFVKSATAGLALLLAAYGVLAAPVADLSRTSVAFPRGGPNIDFGVQPVFVTNIGDAPLVISGAVLGGSNPSEFRVAGTCTPAVTLAPNGRCRPGSP